MPTSTAQLQFRTIETGGYDRVVRCELRSARYLAFIALHRCANGLAVGGTRFTSYASEDAALADALNLSRAMTDKAALARLPFGGGKAVVLQPLGEFDRDALFVVHGEAVESLKGRFITAQDIGTTTADMSSIGKSTTFVAGLPGGLAGDSGPNTALGVLEAMAGVAAFEWGTADLGGRKVAVQGCGKVGLSLITRLVAAGAKVIASDVDPSALRKAVMAGARPISPGMILFEPADILSPCATGGVLNSETIPHLRARAIAGGANNQLATPEDGDRLRAAGIRYVPDFLSSAGGVISGTMDLLGWSHARVQAKLAEIRSTTEMVLRLSDTLNRSTDYVARKLASSRDLRVE